MLCDQSREDLLARDAQTRHEKIYNNPRRRKSCARSWPAQSRLLNGRWRTGKPMSAANCRRSSMRNLNSSYGANYGMHTAYHLISFPLPTGTGGAPAFVFGGSSSGLYLEGMF
jgi:hypothetical protein